MGSIYICIYVSYNVDCWSISIMCSAIMGIYLHALELFYLQARVVMYNEPWHLDTWLTSQYEEGWYTSYKVLHRIDFIAINKFDKRTENCTREKSVKLSWKINNKIHNLLLNIWTTYSHVSQQLTPRYLKNLLSDISTTYSQISQQLTLKYLNNLLSRISTTYFQISQQLTLRYLYNLLSNISTTYSQISQQLTLKYFTNILSRISTTYSQISQ